MKRSLAQRINKFLSLAQPSHKDIEKIVNAVDKEIIASVPDKQKIEAIYDLAERLKDISLEEKKKNIIDFVSNPYLYHLEHTCTSYLLLVAHSHETPQHLVKHLISHSNYYISNAAANNPNSPFVSFT